MFRVKQEMHKSLWFGLAAIWVLLDQLSKYFSVEKLSLVDPTPVFPGFDLILRYNSGAAFNLLADAAGWQRWFFISLALLVIVVIYFWIGKLSSQDKQEAFALSLILGGAIGNLIDRVFHGQVIDFILIYYKEWQWPVFNIADTALCLGALLLIPKVLKKST